MVTKINAASVPRSERILGRANCLATDAVGDVVCVDGPKIGNRFQVKKVNISNLRDFSGVAVIKKKFSVTDCVIHFHGPFSGTYSGLIPGRSYWVGVDGRPARAGDLNYPIGGVNFFQKMGIATSDNELLVIFGDVIFGVPNISSRFFNQRFNEMPNGVIMSFTTAMKFVHGGVSGECVYYSGQRLISSEDYVAVESGGVGTGYDTIVIAVPPKIWSNLAIDFEPDVD